MIKSKLGAKGQLTLPKRLRDDMELKAGASFVVLRLGDGLILVPEQRRFEQLCRKINSTLAAAGVATDDLLVPLPKVRNRVYARRYKTNNLHC